MISLVVTENEKNVSDEALSKIKGNILAKYKAGQMLDTFEIQSVSIIYSEEMSGGYRESDRYEIISGDKITYEEDLLGFRFKVSPFAFF